MFKIVFNGIAGSTGFVSANDAWRHVHEILEETFGLEDDTADAYVAALNEYDVRKI